MPHLVLEYSANLKHAPDFEELLRGLHEALCATGSFELANVKSRVVRQDTFRVADGDPGRAFVHLTVAVLDGREPEVLREAGEALLAVLSHALARSRGEGGCDVTVEVREMRRPLYFKARPAP